MHFFILVPNPHSNVALCATSMVIVDRVYRLNQRHRESFLAVVGGANDLFPLSEGTRVYGVSAASSTTRPPCWSVTVADLKEQGNYNWKKEHVVPGPSRRDRLS